MAIILIEDFGGLAPGVSSHKRPLGTASRVLDIDFTYQDLRGQLTAEEINVEVSSSLIHSVYNYRYMNDTRQTEKKMLLISSVNRHDITPGPVTEDSYQRLYYTEHSDNNYPSFNIKDNLIGPGASGYLVSNRYRLGIPAPVTAPYFIEYTGSGLTFPRDSIYTYTFVSKFGEEGPPSPPSNLFTQTESSTIVLEIPDLVSIPDNSSLEGGYTKRLYRTNPGTTVTDFQFVADIPSGTLTYADGRLPEELGEVIPSEQWFGPPDDDRTLYPSGPLRGLISLPGGVLAGFTGRTVCFSEPYQPHAWPINYRVNFSINIVALGLTTSGLICLTEGLPRLITGSGPAGFIEQTIQSPYPCLNYNSVVNMGAYLLYSSTEGLIAIDGSGARVITEGIISPVQWRDDFYYDTYKAVRYEDTYLAFVKDSYEKSFVIDLRNNTIKISRQNNATLGLVNGGPPIYPYHDLTNDEVIIPITNGISLYAIYNIGKGVDRTPYSIWVSTPILLSTPAVFNWLVIQLGEDYSTLNTSAILNITITGDKKRSHTYSIPVNTERIIFKRVNVSLTTVLSINIQLDKYIIIARIALASSMEEAKGAING